MMTNYCVLGQIDHYRRYGIVVDGIVVKTQVSRPEGREVPMPHPLKFASPTEAEIVPEPKYGWNNVSGDSLKRARTNAGIKLRRKNLKQTVGAK